MCKSFVLTRKTFFTIYMERYQPGDCYINVHVEVHSDRVIIVIPIRLVALSTYIRPQFHLSNVISYRTCVQLQR